MEIKFATGKFFTTERFLAAEMQLNVVNECPIGFNLLLIDCPCVADDIKADIKLYTILEIIVQFEGRR